MIAWIWKNLGTCSLLDIAPEGAIILDVRDIIDGKGNSIEILKMKISVGAGLLSMGQTVIIRCVAGMSRSNLIACAIMTYMVSTRTWNYHWERIRKVAPIAPEMQLMDDVKQTLIKMGVNPKRVWYK